MGRAYALPSDEESIMAYIGYFKTEKNVAAKSNGWLWLEAYFNTDNAKTMRKSAWGSQDIRRIVSPTNIYCHQNAAPEPVTDGHILTSVFDDSETEYSGSGYIKSFTSSSGIFTRNHSLDIYNADWICHFNAKNTGVSSNNVGVFGVEVYKRDTSNNDTLLGLAEYEGIQILYSVSGLSMIVPVAGDVTTLDRLRIRIYMSQRLPT
jgi:hypothetical protein